MPSLLVVKGGLKFKAQNFSWKSIFFKTKVFKRQLTHSFNSMVPDPAFTQNSTNGNTFVPAKKTWFTSFFPHFVTRRKKPLIIYYGNVTLSFWRSLQSKIKETCLNCKNLEFSETLILFGIAKNVLSDKVLHFIMYIYKCKCQKRRPTVKVFKNGILSILQDRCEDERYVSPEINPKFFKQTGFPTKCCSFRSFFFLFFSFFCCCCCFIFVFVFSSSFFTYHMQVIFVVWFIVWSMLKTHAMT